MPISSANKQGNGKAFTTATEIKTLLGLDNTKKEVEVQMLQHPQKQLEELKPKIQELEAANKKAENDKTELQAQLDTAQQEKQDLEAEVEKLKAIDSTALQQQLEEKNAKITELEALDAVTLQQKLTEKENEITALKAQPDAAQLKNKDEKIKDLEAQLSNRPDAEVESLKKDLQAQNARVHQLEKENKELEAKNKTTEQPKQGNGARYTATVGMGLAAGLIAFTALERTVRLDMLVMIGIAVASALVVGGVTYAALPSAQVDGAEAQEVNVNNKGK